jgi:hypothetical protein
MADSGTNRDPAESARALREALRVRNMGWLLRAIGACALVAMALGVIIAPGIRGNGGDAAVEAWDRASSVFAYAMAILASAGSILASADLIGTRRAETGSGALVVGGASLVLVLLVIAVARARVLPDAPMPEPLVVGLALVASSVATASAWRAKLTQETRALAIVIAMLAITALVRVGAWELAYFAGERANPALYALSRSVATVAVVGEALAQLAAAAWIGTRGRAGLAWTTLATVGAFAVTWGAASGVHADAARWAAALHTALAEGSGLPVPSALGAAQSFLTASAILLGLGAVAQSGENAAIAGAMALALVSRGAFDAPLRALAVVTAAQWALAMSDGAPYEDAGT